VRVRRTQLPPIPDAIIAPGNAPDMNKFIDVHMLVLNHGGKERTEPEFRSLFDAAGFRVTNVIPTLGPMCIIEGA